jgi:hypothetical protein
VRFVRDAFGLVLGIVLAVAPITGCQLKTIKIRLAGFADGKIDALWFWRPSGGKWTRICHYSISDPFLDGGVELVEYVQWCLDERGKGMTWRTKVQRLPADPNTVTLVLLYSSLGAATPHRASAVNAAGESALSSTALPL